MLKSYIVDSTCNNMRIDRWIRNTIGKIPQGLIEKTLRSGKIKVNKKKIKSSYKIKSNDKIDFYNFKFKERIIQKKIGFRVLMNENKHIVRGDENIAIIGVENWGARFNQLGDIDKSIKNISDKDFKIVLSHDPTHWERVLKDHPKKFDLTLSYLYREKQNFLKILLRFCYQFLPIFENSN